MYRGFCNWGITRDHLNCSLPGEVMSGVLPGTCRSSVWSVWMCVWAPCVLLTPSISPSDLPLAGWEGKGTFWWQPCYLLWTLLWDWTGAWLVMVLKLATSEALAPVQPACICCMCLSGSMPALFWLQVMGLRQQALLVWDSPLLLYFWKLEEISYNLWNRSLQRSPPPTFVKVWKNKKYNRLLKRNNP